MASASCECERAEPNMERCPMPHTRKTCIKTAQKLSTEQHPACKWCNFIRFSTLSNIALAGWALGLKLTVVNMNEKAPPDPSART
eukprot:4506495-Amphidinium_carterae.1